MQKSPWQDRRRSFSQNWGWNSAIWNGSWCSCTFSFSFSLFFSGHLTVPEATRSLFLKQSGFQKVPFPLIWLLSGLHSWRCKRQPMTRHQKTLRHLPLLLWDYSFWTAAMWVFSHSPWGEPKVKELDQSPTRTPIHMRMPSWKPVLSSVKSLDEAVLDGNHKELKYCWILSPQKSWHWSHTFKSYLKSLYFVTQGYLFH